MTTATITILKKELKEKSENELIELCLSLAKFKKENKELLTYLLFERDSEENYINEIKEEIDTTLVAINFKSYYYARKGIRKLLRTVKKYIRYSKKPSTEIELVLHFLKKTINTFPDFIHYTAMLNMYATQLRIVEKKIKKLHEDLQYDYNKEIEAIKIEIDLI